MDPMRWDHPMEQWLEAVLGGDPQVRGSPPARAAPGRGDGDAVPTPVVDKAINTAVLLLAMGQGDRACVVLEPLLDCCGREPTLLNNLAFAHLVGGRLDRAVALWEQAAELAPGDSLIASNLARARQRKALLGL